MRKIVIVILLIVAVVSCTNIDCPVQNSVMTTYGLRKSGSGEVDTMGIDTMWVRLKRVDHTDTLLINRLCGAKATNFQIPDLRTIKVGEQLTVHKADNLSIG